MYKIKNQDKLIKTISQHQQVFSTLINEANTTNLIVNLLHKKLKKGGKIMFCGNGGSAADAQHLSAEFVDRLRPAVNRKAMPILSLALDTSHLTACSNDYSFEDVFVRPLEAFGKKKIY